jgi:iron complex outermembrane receptor protein
MCTLVSIAASAIELRVVDPSGSPLAGSHIMVIGRSGSVIADRDGRARIEPDPEPPFVLLVSRPDGVALKPVTVQVLPDGGLLEVTVETAGETVTVVSGVIPDLEVPPAVAATIIGGTDLKQRRPVRLTQTLENIPGAGHTGNGHSAVPGLRGLPKHRTLLLLDDGRVVSERRAGPSATFLNPDTIDEVEVVRGPGSVAYGSDAFGGIIRARSRMPSPAGAFGFRYGLLAGSVANEFGGSAEVTTALGGGGFLIGAQYRDFGNYSSPEGEVENSAAEDFGVRLAYQRPVGSGILRLGWRSDAARDVGKPAPDSDLNRVYYPDENSHRFSLGFEKPGPGAWSRISVGFLWDSYQLVLAKDRVATATDPRRLTESDVTAQDYEARIEAERPLGGARWVVGANAYGRFNLHASEAAADLDPDGGVIAESSQVSIDSARSNDVGLFTALTRDWDRWGVAAGLRGDWVRAENRGGVFGDLTVTNTDASGFLAVTWRGVDDLEVSFQAARGFRDALLSDRFYEGQTGRGEITGNPFLDPESSRQLDLAVRYRANRWQVAGFAYLYRIRDLIERYREGDDFFFRNRGEGEITGVEVEGSVAVGAGVQLQGGLHWIRGEVLDDGSATDDVPPPGAFLVVRSSDGSRLSWMVRGAVFGRDDRPGPTEQIVPGYGLVDAAIGYRLSDAAQIQLLGRNLLDTAHLASADADAVLAPGRSIQLNVRGLIGGR